MASKKSKGQSRRRKRQPSEPAAAGLGALTRRSLPWWAKLIVIAAGSIIVTWVLIGEDIDARWGMLDDHEIVHMIGPDQEIGVGEFWPLLMSTEIGRAGSATRFRPSYYSLRIAEMIAWGDSPRAWYLSRMAMMALSVGLSWLAMSLWIGLPGAGFFVLYCLTLPCWGDIWCRLGPGESYCVPAAALFALAMAALWRRAKPARPDRAGAEEDPGGARAAGRWSGAGWWLAAAVGAGVTMGSKEPFVLMLLPAWVVAIRLVRVKRMSLAGWALLGLTSAYGIFIAVVTAVGLRTVGTDVYSQSVGAGRAALAGESLTHMADHAAWQHLAALAVVAAILIVWRKRWRQFVRPLAILAIQGLCLAGLFASQYVVYKGQWPPVTARYGFPGLLAEPLLWAAWAVCVWKMLRIVGAKWWILAPAYLAAVIALVALTVDQGFGYLRFRCKRNAIVTQAVTRGFERAAEVLRNEPDRPVLVVCFRPQDIEPAVAISRFFTYLRIENPLFVRMNWPVGQMELSGVDQKCEDDLRQISEKGQRGFAPWSRFDPNDGFYSIGLSGDTRGVGKSLGRFW